MKSIEDIPKTYFSLPMTAGRTKERDDIVRLEILPGAGYGVSGEDARQAIDRT